MPLKRWILPSCRPENDKALTALAARGLGPVLSRILLAREQDEHSLECGGELSDPFALRDMEKAVHEIRSATEAGERIAVFGDYDCDGITATALLVSYLQDVGADVIYYVPVREGEGYGLNCAAVDWLHAEGVALVITVDNGVSSHEEIAYAAGLGIRMVVTDHHTPRETLPAAAAILNPHRSDDESGLTELAGVGVAFKLVCALEGDLTGSELLEHYAELVTIGTVADVVPLTGENRILVRHGLARLADTGRAGLSALLERCAPAGKPLGAETIAYTIAPRLNALGRMGTVDEAIELLLTDDVRYAREIVDDIEEQNQRRRAAEDEILVHIEGILAAEPQLTRRRLLTVAGEGWHQGVLGIVASRLGERYGKPVIVFSLDKETARGSARSLPGFSVIGAVSACSARLTRFGGHPLAAGMTLPREELAAFIEELEAYAASAYPCMPHPTLEIDCVLARHELEPGAIAQVSLLEPYGAGNRQPLFLLPGLRIQAMYPTKDAKHLRLQLAWPDGRILTAIAFRTTAEQFPYMLGDVVDMAATVSLSWYEGREQISVVAKAFRHAGAEDDGEVLLACERRYENHLRGEYGIGEREELLPTRDEVVAVYRFLRRVKRFRHSTEQLWHRLRQTGSVAPPPYDRLLVALDAFGELGLITRASGEICCVENPKEVELDSAPTLAGLRKEQVAG